MPAARQGQAASDEKSSVPRTADVTDFGPEQFKDRFRMQGKLGIGAFSIVYKAVLDDKPVALKVLNQVKRKREQGLMFFREARALKRMDHRHIVRCHQLVKIPAGVVSTSDGSSRWALVLDLMEGGSLARVVANQMTTPNRKLYSEQQALTWLRQVASALSYLHGMKSPIIHRDVKLDNILLTKAPSADPAAILADFGLHLALDERRPPIPPSFVKPASTRAAEGQAQDTEAKQESKVAGEDQAGQAAHPEAAQATKEVQSEEPSRSPASPEKIRTNTASPDADARQSYVTDDSFRNGSSCGANLETLDSLWSCVMSGEEEGLESDMVFVLSGCAGSLMYMAPEVYCGKEYSEKVDVFSFGCAMFELLSRSLLVYTHAKAQVLAEMAVYAQKVSKGYRPSRPAAITNDRMWELICACWETDPVKRPAMAAVEVQLGELIKALEESMQSSQEPVGSGCRCTIS